MRRVSFLIWPIVTGIMAAVLILQMFPDLLSPQVTTIEIKETKIPQVGPTYPPLGSGPVSYADAVGRAAPAVVNIYTQKVVRQSQHPLADDPFFRRFFDLGPAPQRERIQSSLGSGVILATEGYIVTNNHVIAGADSIIVALRDGREARAEIVGSDTESDLAVLKIDLPNLPSLSLNTTDSLRIGDVVLAIGNPFGVGQTVTMGIISATNREGLGLNTYENFIQTDAAINPGNSGGALIDAYGSLIGINTAIFSKSGGSQGIGFAIPAELAKQVMQDLISYGRVVRGWLGVEFQQMTPELAESFGLEELQGLLVAGIFRNGPAHKAGMLPGDIIVAIGHSPVINARYSINKIAQVKPGQEVPVEILRNGERKKLTITAGERPARQNK